MLGFFAVLVLLVAGDKVDGPVIGIDFGTTFSCVGIFRHGVVEIIPSEQGNRIMPSYVAFTDEKETFVGEAAKNLADAAPQRTVFDVKRLIGRTFKDDALQRDIKALPFKVVADSDGQAAVLVGKEQLRPEEIAGMILRKLRERAEGYLEQPVKHAAPAPDRYERTSRSVKEKVDFVTAGTKPGNIGEVKIISACRHLNGIYPESLTDSESGGSGDLKGSIEGLQTLRALQQLPGTEKIVLFERAEEVGGVWRQNYCGFGAQVKRDVYCFAELGPEGLDLYPSGRQLQASCRRYAERFGLLPCLRTGAEVVGLERREDGGWRVTYRRRGAEQVEDFDFVVLALGNFSQPYVPEVPNSQAFQGQVLHSSELLDPSLLRGREVLVVGYGKSALDCLALASKEAKRVTLVARSPAWILPQRFLGLPLEWLAATRWFANLVFPPYHDAGLVRRCLGYLALPLQTLLWWILSPLVWLHFCLPWAMWPAYSLRWQLWHGHSVSICNASALKEAFRRPNVRCLRGQISSFTASGAVVEDFYSKRSEELPAQVVIFATGYQECWSHLFDPDLVAALAPHGDGPDLYKQILPTEEVPGLAFIGRILSTCDIVVSHVQAQWLARLLGGSFAAPGLPSRRAAARRYRAWRNQFLPSTGAASRRSVPRVFSYLEELMDDWQEGRRAGCLDFFRPLRAVNLAVLTVPAFFNDGQRRAMQKAGQLAGLEILRILNEPTAAAIAYGYEKQDAEEVLLVYDLGGGTCDVSVLEVKGGVLQVRATSGDPRLGGEDFDQKLVAHLMSAFKKKTAKEPRDARAVARLRSEAEKAKRKLSTVPQAAVKVDGFADGADLSEPLTRAQFEKLNSELFQRTLEPVRSALKDAGLEKSQITQVILAGGSARIPKIQQMLSQFFEKELIRSINPDEVVAHGAAIQAAALSSDGGEEELRLIDVTPLSLGIQTAGGFMTTVLARNSPLPAENSMVFSTHKDNQEYATVKVFEGERLMAKNNHLLGSFQIKGISPAPRGVPQIQVSFKVDAGGLLAVEALDRTSGNSEQLEVKEALSQDQIQEMLREAETFAKEDQRDFARAEALLALKLLARAAESAAETALEEDSAIFLAAAAEAKDWLAANPDAEAEEIHEKREELQAEMPEMPSAGAGAGASGAAGGGELDMEGHDEL
ncbi:unnamed protein product [Effrenium voratum]|nr:unnamed protein product [Effrenium voratum]